MNSNRLAKASAKHSQPLALLIIALALAATLSMTAPLLGIRGMLPIVACVAFGLYASAVKTDLYLKVAIVAIPFTPLIRRLTAGPTAYQLNDPLVLLPLAFAAPIFISFLVGTSSLTPSTTLLKIFASWLAVSALAAMLLGTSVPVAGYNLLAQLVPVMCAIVLSRGQFPQFLPWCRRVYPIVGAVVAVYGIVQWLAPQPWDLAWLRTQSNFVTSIGVATQGQFRIFSTGESPGAIASTLGVGILAAVAPMITPKVARPLPGLMRVMTFLYLLAMAFCLLLTSVRSVLFAIPVVLLVTSLVVNRRLNPALIGVAVVLAVAALALPSLLRSSDDQSRYDLGNLSNDQSFQDRALLLPKFEDAVTTHPLGSGVGSSGLSSRLENDGPNSDDVETVDNGYLARLQEVGVPGLTIYFGVVLTAFRIGANKLRHKPSATTGWAIAIVTFFVLSDLSGPATLSNYSIVFWCAIGVLSRKERKLTEPLR